MPKIFQDVRKRDHKARTFAPSDNNDEVDKKIKDSAEEVLALNNLLNLKKVDDSTKLNSIKREFDKIKRPEDLKMAKFLENINKYESINLNDVNDLIEEIKENITMGDNIVDLGDGKEVYFNDLNNFLYDIKDGKINNSNKEKEYEKKFEDIENKLTNRKKYNKNIRLYEKYLNYFKKILFSNKKSSGKGLTISSLPILLSELNISSSKELMSDIKQLINNLYNNKQVTKKVYNNLNKAITYKNDS